MTRSDSDLSLDTASVSSETASLGSVSPTAAKAATGRTPEKNATLGLKAAMSVYRSYEGIYPAPTKLSMQEKKSSGTEQKEDLKSDKDHNI